MHFPRFKKPAENDQIGYGKFGGKSPNFSEKAENFALHARSCLAGSFAPTFNHLP